MTEIIIFSKMVEIICIIHPGEIIIGFCAHKMCDIFICQSDVIKCTQIPKNNSINPKNIKTFPYNLSNFLLAHRKFTNNSGQSQNAKELKCEY